MTTSQLPEIIPDYQVAKKQEGASRAQILAAEAYIKSDPDHKGMADYPLEHFHAANVYGRKIIIPADTIMTGMIHKHACINVILQGKVSVATHDSVTLYEAPCTFISSPGSKRVLHTHEETHWMTFHGSGETDLLKLQDEFVCETYEQYDNFINTQQRLTAHNGQIELFGEQI